MPPEPRPAEPLGAEPISVPATPLHLTAEKLTGQVLLEDTKNQAMTVVSPAARVCDQLMVAVVLEAAVLPGPSDP